ncbi:Y-family DNA polymerase [Spiroplasma alleghenense]|uniref:DNA polymerase IV n=1 Tax=Spiroplasma alleghenense TaxID=216931 RepID=A0A345Z3I9_9MOLU|nr:DNA polymerase IV [Spiroplasma alleghenense]AXK51168.1 DNA polymerase IV [Spiroplasma alleghenense]
MDNNKVIFLIDLDAFFASCSMAKNKLPLNSIVGVASPNSRSIITAASYAARNLGIKAGMPVFQAKKISKDLIILPTDFKTYIEFSSKIFDLIYNNFSKKMEVASIDECYVDVTQEYKKFKSVTNMAEAIKSRIMDELNVSCSIGISTNKFLAKTAVEFKKPYGTMVILPHQVPQLIWPLEIRKMFGIGIATAEILNKNNIFTIGDIANTEISFLESLLGKNGRALKLNALGKGDDEVAFQSNEMKSIGNEMTLEFPTSNEEELRSIIYWICKNISKRLKQRSLQPKTFAIVLRFEKTKGEIFNKRMHKKTTTRQETIIRHTNNFEEILSVAQSCFDYLWKGESVSLIGVRSSNLISEIEGFKQIDFENLKSRERKNDLEQVAFDINFSLNSEKVFTADKLKSKLDKNISQSKFLTNDDVHISNEQVKNKWKK